MRHGATNLFQFWHDETPPEEVAVLLEAWERDPGFRHRRFDTETADAYIARHLGERARAAFRRCAVPAMQADLFRYCALFIEGGVYLDADSENRGGLAKVIAEVAKGLLASRRNGPQVKIINGFLFVRSPGDPLFERTIGIAIENIERRVSNNVWEVTGPGIMTGLYRDAATRSLFDGFDIRPNNRLGEAYAFLTLPYKGTLDDWRVSVYFPDGGFTIFRD